jgi:hypothetical protein
MMNLSNRKITWIQFTGAVLFLILATGCGSRAMRVVPKNLASYPPKPGKGLIVFMRPSIDGYGNKSSLFKITPGGAPQLVGILWGQTKIAYYTEPGKNLFMVIGEKADFLEANLQEGKTFYSLIVPEPGMWKTHFTLRPIPLAESKTKEFVRWYTTSKWVENTPAAFRWAKEHSRSIEIKKTRGLGGWEQKSDKPTLLPADGK